MSDHDDLARIERDLRNQLAHLSKRRPIEQSYWIPMLIGVLIAVGLITVGFFVGIIVRGIIS